MLYFNVLSTILWKNQKTDFLMYVWIYENGVKEFVPGNSSKGDDMKITRKVSLFPSTHLSFFYCCPFPIFFSFTWLGGLLLGVVKSK